MSRNKKTDKLQNPIFYVKGWGQALVAQIFNLKTQSLARTSGKRRRILKK